MAVTANQLIVSEHPSRNNVPVAASTRIYQGTLVFSNSNGYAVGVIASGATQFLGIAKEDTDTSSGSNGDKNVELLTEGIFELVGSGFTQADVGKPVYASDNYTITVTNTNMTLIGRIVGFISATRLRVMIHCA